MIELLNKRKIIRDFLSLFTENYWKQLIGTMLEYGIIIFNKHHKVASLTPEDIIELIEKMKIDQNINEKKRTNSRTKNLLLNNSKSDFNIDKSKGKDKNSTKNSRNNSNASKNY